MNTAKHYTYSYDRVWVQEVRALVLFHLSPVQHNNLLLVREARAAIRFLQIAQHGHNQTEAQFIIEIYNDVIYQVEIENLSKQ